jgi:hypothetical protein
MEVADTWAPGVGGSRSEVHTAVRRGEAFAARSMGWPKGEWGAVILGQQAHAERSEKRRREWAGGGRGRKKTG